MTELSPTAQTDRGAGRSTAGCRPQPPGSRGCRVGATPSRSSPMLPAGTGAGGFGPAPRRSALSRAALYPAIRGDQGHFVWSMHDLTAIRGDSGHCVGWRGRNALLEEGEEGEQRARRGVAGAAACGRGRRGPHLWVNLLWIFLVEADWCGGVPPPPAAPTAARMCLPALSVERPVERRRPGGRFGRVGGVHGEGGRRRAAVLERCLVLKGALLLLQLVHELRTPRPFKHTPGLGQQSIVRGGGGRAGRGVARRARRWVGGWVRACVCAHVCACVGGVPGGSSGRPSDCAGRSPVPGRGPAARPAPSRPPSGTNAAPSGPRPSALRAPRRKGAVLAKNGGESTSERRCLCANRSSEERRRKHKRKAVSMCPP